MRSDRKQIQMLPVWCGLGVVALAVANVHASLGTVYLDYDGGSFSTRDAGDFTQTETYEVGALDVTQFGLVAGDLAAVKAKIKSELEALYAGFTIAFDDGAAPPAGDYHTLFIGEDILNPAGAGVTGIASAIDWRNLGKNDKAMIFTKEVRDEDTGTHGAGNEVLTTVNKVGLALANVAGHELGHILGLSHTDIIGGTGPADRRMMNSANTLFQTNKIHRYSKTKLGFAQDGIASIDTLGVGNTFAAGLDVTGDIANDALNINGILSDDSDVDFFKFTLTGPTKVTIEVYSSRLIFSSITGHDASLVPDFIDPELQLWSDATTLVDVGANGGQLVNVDGSSAFDDLIFEVMLDAGTYAFSIEMGNAAYDNVNGEGGAGGFYEVLLIIPEPKTAILLLLTLAALGRRRAAV